MAAGFGCLSLWFPGAYHRLAVTGIGDRRKQPLVLMSFDLAYSLRE